MKNPNGFGGITKLSGNRRKPYRVRITVGWDYADGKAKQIFKTVGYYATQREAMEALIEYNKFPTAMQNNMTFAKVYERWSREHFPSVGDSMVQSYKAAYDVCAPLHDIRFADLRLDHLQSVVDHSGKKTPALLKVKVLMNQLFAYAMKHDICVKDYAKFVQIPEKEEKEEKHKIFTTAEIGKMWESAENSMDFRVILILMCGGFRIGELLDLTKANVDMDNHIVHVKKAKTSAGVRIVPIADCVYPYWQELMEIPGEYVVQNNGAQMSYRAFLRSHFPCGDHFPHDTRYTFVSAMTSAGISSPVIKRLVGHASRDLTERVYTHFEIQQLRDAVNTPDWTSPFIGTITV